VDLLLIDSRFLQNITPKKRIEKQYRKTLADDFLLKDKEIFRIYPLGREFSQNRWAFYNQTIGGYHGAKLKRYQEILDNCLNIEFQNRIPINWNIVNMLNAKYVIYPEKLPLENLEYAFYDRKQKQTIYKNVNYLTRAWFVEKTELIEKKENIWKRLNQQEFDPAKMAIVEEEIPKTYAPDSTAVNLVEFDIHNLKFEVKTDTTSFLTISEIYYPAGWKAYIDGEETEIYATNYILRGVVVPKGEHILEMKFAPETYALSLKLSLIGIILTIVLLIVGLILYIRENYRGEIIYVLKK
ncbi:MAG: YfhO family protein, partial [Candidatus Cloacimonetes bacterium]|nr:YfhO family protein [Candidatus Cloacimonadota bacterium]